MAKIKDFTPDPKNANRGTVRGLAALDTSLRKHGAGRSILVDKNNRVIAGNKTLERAADVGIDDVVIVESDGTKLVAVKRTDLDLETDPAARSLAYYDNRVGELDLEWEPLQIAADLEAGLDLDGLFNPDEIAAMLEAAGTGLLGKPKDVEPQIDRAKELQEKWGTATGQVWQLGRHRLIVGDCTDRATVERLMEGERAQGVITDPPYAFGLSSTSKMAAKSGGWHDIMNNASWFTDRYRQYNELVKSGPVWLCCNWRTLPILMRAGFESGVGIESVMVWYKDWIGPGGVKGLRPTYEFIALTVLGDYSIPDRNIEDFVNVPWSSHKPTGHRAEKPERLIAHLVTVSGINTIFDPFLGSGTTLVACENLNRQCRGIEIDPGYCAVTIQRWVDLTGLQPQQVSD